MNQLLAPFKFEIKLVKFYVNISFFSVISISMKYLKRPLGRNLLKRFTLLIEAIYCIWTKFVRCLFTG